MNPTADKVARYVTALHALKAEDRLRGLKPRSGIDFASNDYLALASAPRMKQAVSAALEAGPPLGSRGCPSLCRKTPWTPWPYDRNTPHSLPGVSTFLRAHSL